MTASQITLLVAYLDLLVRWNRKINLTGLMVDPPNEEALERLIIEPISAARFIPETARTMIDIGSGGGSPAIPMRIARPALRLMMVESKVRKSAFLREVARQLDLADALVENCRFEELLARPDLHECADLITMRAVRIEPRILRTALGFLRRGGRVFLFRSQESQTVLPDTVQELALVRREMLLRSTGSHLDVLERRFA
jgi:16S rRNA (guanine527-N7)-methyltransferase